MAMLLPLRGVSAAVVACDQLEDSHMQTVVMPHDHEVHGAASQGEASGSHDHDGFDRARHCVSSCAATPLISALPSVATPEAASATDFPRFAAPAPTFQSDGPDRPPRSI